MVSNKKIELLGERVIGVIFYRFGRTVKTLRYKHLDRACKGAFGHVDQNRYQATRVEVVHLEEGKVYLTFYITAEGNIYSFYNPKFAKAALKEHRQVLKPSRDEDVPEGTPP